MSGKRCHADLHDRGSEDDQMSLRPRYDFQNNSDQLRDLINNQLKMLPPDLFNMIEILHELVDEQHEWLGMYINKSSHLYLYSVFNNTDCFQSNFPISK